MQRRRIKDERKVRNPVLTALERDWVFPGSGLPNNLTTELTRRLAGIGDS